MMSSSPWIFPEDWEAYVRRDLKKAESMWITFLVFGGRRWAVEEVTKIIDGQVRLIWYSISCGVDAGLDGETITPTAIKANYTTGISIFVGERTNAIWPLERNEKKLWCLKAEEREETCEKNSGNEIATGLEVEESMNADRDGNLLLGVTDKSVEMA